MTAALFLDFPCATCGACKGEHCVSVASGVKLGGAHVARMQAENAAWRSKHYCVDCDRP